MNNVKLLLIEVFKSVRMRRLVQWHVWGRGKMHTAFWRVNLKKRDNMKHMHRWKGSIKIELKELGCEGMDWIYMAHGRDGWRADVAVLAHSLVVWAF
jgi:hypothetical protein